MPGEFTVTEENFSKVERRFLLFQVAINDPSLNTVLIPRGLSDSRQSQDTVRISDPVDYDNPGSPLYWRNVSKFEGGGYVEELTKQFKIFTKDFQEAISSGSVRLKNTNDKPYVDISDFVKASENYSVKLEGLDNRLSLIIARPDSTDLVPGKKSAPGEILVNFTDDVFGTLNPQENDIVVVKSAYDPNGDFDPEYIGMITKVSKNFNYGRVDSFSLEIFGLSKLFYSTQTVSSKSLNSKEFIPGIELNDPSKPTVFSNNFNEKDVREIFNFVLANSLSCKEVDQNTAQFLYRMDPTVFISFAGFGFQHNIFALLALYLMSVTESPQGAEGSIEQRLFQKKAPTSSDFLVSGFNSDAKNAAAKVGVPSRTAAVPLLQDFFVRGVLERGSQLAYNRMVKHGFEKFFSQMAKASDVLGEVRSNTYNDVFESRDGVMVCRPPRFNKVEETSSEFSRISAEQVPEVLLSLSPEKVWEFNPDAQFVIKAEETKSIGSIDKDEMALESRVDIKPIFPLVGDIDYPAALYVDPDILFRYGLRTHGPITNPNVSKKALARLFAPIALAMINAPTRTLEATVKDTRKFYVGKLYYLEAIDMVAYLASDTINHTNGALSTRNLSFTMLRQVVRRPISEILRSPAEVLNVGMMFTDDFPTADKIQQAATHLGLTILDSNTGKPTNALTPKNFMYSKGFKFLNDLMSRSTAVPAQPDAETLATQASDPSVLSIRESKAGTAHRTADARLVMFKYVPGIDDLIMEVESDQRLADPPAEKSGDPVNASRAAKEERLKTKMDDSNFLYYTSGFKSGIAENADDRLRYTDLIIGISSKAINEQGPSFTSLNDPVAIDYDTDPRAPMSVAGLLGYVFPTLPNPGTIQIPSSFVEVPGNFPISYMRSPFLADALSDPPQNIALSGLLMNKLVNLDLDMKFNTDLTSKITMNDFGIPQYYYLDGADFILFGSRRRPNDYLQRLATVRDNLTVSNFQNQILKSPSCLKLNKDLTAFENDFFTIPVRSGSFDLPFGHFVLKQGNKPGDLAFFRVSGGQSRQGGSFSITPGPLLNEFLIKALDSNSKTTDENNPSAVRGQLDPPLQVASPNGIYFMSPFLEPTIERLLNIYLPPKYGGNLAPAEADKQKKLSTKGALNSQAKRQNGQAINLSPDVLFLSSQANIKVVNGQRPKTVPLADPSLPPIYRLFESQVVRAFKAGTAFPVADAFEGDLVLPDGTNLGKQVMVFYTLGVEAPTELNYAARLQQNGTAQAATVGA